MRNGLRERRRHPRWQAYAQSRRPSGKRARRAGTRRAGIRRCRCHGSMAAPEAAHSGRCKARRGRRSQRAPHYSPNQSPYVAQLHHAADGALLQRATRTSTSRSSRCEIQRATQNSAAAGTAKTMVSIAAIPSARRTPATSRGTAVGDGRDDPGLDFLGGPPAHCLPGSRRCHRRRAGSPSIPRSSIRSSPCLSSIAAGSTSDLAPRR